MGPLDVGGCWSGPFEDRAGRSNRTIDLPFRVTLMAGKTEQELPQELVSKLVSMALLNIPWGLINS
jgi:hypothetical protein